MPIDSTKDSSENQNPQSNKIEGRNQEKDSQFFATKQALKLFAGSKRPFNGTSGKVNPKSNDSLPNIPGTHSNSDLPDIQPKTQLTPENYSPFKPESVTNIKEAPVQLEPFHKFLVKLGKDNPDLAQDRTPQAS